MSDLDELERLAKAATPGPWLNVGLEVLGVGTGIFVADTVTVDTHDNCLKNADFIAAANPEAVLALVARVREAEAERDEARATIREALSVARFGSVPVGVSEARHFDRLLAETRAVLLGDGLNGADDE